ncbi:MAG: hypothetical protein KZQ78_16300 [Candidatus Thiodiazotropha sp. (ex Ustalcina ferruginea)]|nr:hypothetical protein [Candidatus Thiodiazotropha sp. (ex Ustalcina ferruginea)]
MVRLERIAVVEEPAIVKESLTVRQATLEHAHYRKVIDVQQMQVDKDLEAVIGKLMKEGGGK